MAEERESQPTPLSVAQIFESLVVHEHAYVECQPALKWMLRHGERSRELFDELTRPRNDAPPLLDLAKLLLAISDRRFSDCYETALWAVQQCAEGRQAYAELCRLAEDTGDVVARDRWPVGVVQRNREVDRLLAADDDWTDPIRVLDPSGDNVTTSAYAEWLSICRARRQRGEGDADRLDAAIRKIEAAGERASYTGKLVARVEALEPAMTLLEAAGFTWKKLERALHDNDEEAEP